VLWTKSTVARKRGPKKIVNGRKNEGRKLAEVGKKWQKRGHKIFL
jgi:hypothetical protein